MTPIQKAKEIAESAISFFILNWGTDSQKEVATFAVNAWLTHPDHQSLLSGEDWKEDGKKTECYVPVAVTKFGDLPTPMEAVVVFFKNRKEPWVAYREIDNIWFFESGESCKTPTHWLKKIKK